MRKIPELLSPAGGILQLKAAVQNGADAVYLGGHRFNARIKADNFSKRSFDEALCYAHERNVKIYVTVNTLLKDDELKDAFSYINDLYKAGADAVILQDVGLANLAAKYLPEMELHLSTQATVYNEYAMDMVKSFGFSRIVPARELSLDEIGRIVTKCHNDDEPCQVEVFAHGALCMCYSGQCQMSRVLGGVNGRSGNRGLCAQPCRLPYINSRGKEEYLLSPKDMCTLEILPELCSLGVDSLKLEGRLKSPQYVAVVTSVYRKYLDMYRDMGEMRIDNDDLDKLNRIFNRGGFTTGYMMGNPGKALLSGKSPKNRGVLCGKVTGVKGGSTLIDVLPCEAIRIGDGVEIHGKKITGNVLSYVKELPEGKLRIGDIKGRVNVGDRVFKVTDKEFLKNLEQTYKRDVSVNIDVAMRFEAKVGEYARLLVRELQDDNSDVTVVSDNRLEPSRGETLNESRIEAQLGKLGNTPYRLQELEIIVDPGCMLSVSVINSMRREAVERLNSRKTGVKRKGLPEETIDEIFCNEIHDDSNSHDGAVGCPELRERYLYYFFSEKSLRDFDLEKMPGPMSIFMPVKIYMDSKWLADKIDKIKVMTDIEIIPYIINVSRGNEDIYIKDNFERIATAVNDGTIAIGNMGWIKKFQKRGIRVIGDYGLNVYNRASEKAFEERGVKMLSYSHEGLVDNVDEIPLMITEHPISDEYITDRRGKKYDVITCVARDKFLIFSNTNNDKKIYGNNTPYIRGTIYYFH